MSASNINHSSCSGDNNDSDDESKRGHDLSQPVIYIGSDADTESLNSDKGMCLNDTYEDVQSQESSKQVNLDSDNSCVIEDLVMSEVYMDPDYEEAVKENREVQKNCIMAKENIFYEHEDNCSCFKDDEKPYPIISQVQDEEYSFKCYDKEGEKSDGDSDDSWTDDGEWEDEKDFNNASDNLKQENGNDKVDIDALLDEVMPSVELVGISPCGCHSVKVFWG